MSEKAAIDVRRGIAAAIALILPLLLGACGDEEPYTDDSGGTPPADSTMVVRAGDTLPVVAARYGVSVATLDAMNDLVPRSTLYPGEILRLPVDARETGDSANRAPASSKTSHVAHPKKDGTESGAKSHASAVTVRDLPSPGKHPQSASSTAQVKPTPRPVRENETTLSGPAALAGATHAPQLVKFVWPMRGCIIVPFGRDGDGERNDGINIAARLGQPIRASAAGTVTYAGNALKGYGNLILIAHGDGYVTAYAHAQDMAVIRGDHVQRGEVIGTAGKTGEVDRPQLHFEIRRGLQPVDPKLLLAAR